MAIKRHSTNFNLREDIFDSITPNNVVQEEIRAPAGEWKPAAWLPVQYTSTSASAGTDAYVISSGKVVAFDTQNRVVPAGLRTQLGGNALAGSFAGTVLTYTATDVSWGVVDLTTGVRLTAAVSYTGEQLCDALIERGLVREADATAAGATVPVAADADCAFVIDLFISRPVGVAAYDVHVWGGLAEDGDQMFTNYTKQHLIMFLTELQMQVPQRVAGATTTDAFDAATLAGGTAFAAGSAIAAGEYWSNANLIQLARYTGAASGAVAIGLAQANVAKETDRTLLTCDRTGVLVRQRKTAADIAKEGDYFLDHTVGVLVLSDATWATLVALGAVNTTFSYSFYTDTGVAAAHKHIHFDGPCRPGDFVVSDSESNFTVATPAQVAASGEIVGRVLNIQSQPIPLLNEVKTAWQLSGMSAASQMPGSATKGFTDLITLSGETVADSVIVVNVRV